MLESMCGLVIQTTVHWLFCQSMFEHLNPPAWCRSFRALWFQQQPTVLLPHWSAASCEVSPASNHTHSNSAVDHTFCTHTWWCLLGQQHLNLVTTEFHPFLKVTWSHMVARTARWCYVHITAIIYIEDIPQLYISFSFKLCVECNYSVFDCLQIDLVVFVMSEL